MRHLEVVPVVVGALRVVSKRLDAWFEKLGIAISMRLLHKTLSKDSKEGTGKLKETK